MGFYQRKPEIVEAYRVGAPNPPEWLLEMLLSYSAIMDSSGRITLIEKRRPSAEVGDWIFQKKGGRITILTDLEFREKYERLKNGTSI